MQHLKQLILLCAGLSWSGQRELSVINLAGVVKNISTQDGFTNFLLTVRREFDVQEAMKLSVGLQDLTEEVFNSLDDAETISLVNLQFTPQEELRRAANPFEHEFICLITGDNVLLKILKAGDSFDLGKIENLNQIVLALNEFHCVYEQIGHSGRKKVLRGLAHPNLAAELLTVGHSFLKGETIWVTITESALGV